MGQPYEGFYTKTFWPELGV